MQISFYCFLIFIIGISCTQGVFRRARYRSARIIDELSSDTLGMDEAYLIIRNTNYSENILVLTNVIACENCDFEEIANVAPGSNTTRIISTIFPYNIQIQTSPSKKPFHCPITWYDFGEHGTYVLEVIETAQLNGDACSITQIGETSYFWMPAIVGILFFVSLIVFIQLWQRLYLSRYFDHLLSNVTHHSLIKNDLGNTAPSNSSRHCEADNGVTHITINTSDSPLVGTSHPSINSNLTSKMLPKRLRSLDTFRGYSLMMMIFVNYGGGGYWFFAHSIWHGLTMADVMFPWFAWMMGVSIVLSQRSLRNKAIRKRSLFLKICRRTVIIFLLGMATQGGSGHLADLRIFATLQRLASCYFFTAILVLFLDGEDDRSNASIGDDGDQPIRVELSNTVLKFWLQWFIVLLITIAWVLIMFFLAVPNCPKGYFGPGGKHDHGNYENCTGGAAGYVDRFILSNSHMYDDPTCKEVYNTKVPFDPEGILGILTGILMCYLGVHAGHIFVHSTRVRRVCTHWLVSGMICGFFGLLLSKGGHTDGWIPINTNLWSLSFILVVAGLAFIILTILYLVVDVRQWFTGAPFLWLGMNSIVIYTGHMFLEGSFPVQFEVDQTHVKLMAVNIYGALFWTLVAAFMFYKKVFITI